MTRGRGEMEYSIDQEIVDKAATCRNGHGCLDAAAQRVCGAVAVSRDKCLLTSLNGATQCAYRDCRHGLTYTCSCPVRVALYRKYRI